jgi:hypothetical protein
VQLPHVALSPLVLPLLSCRRSICDDSSADYTQLHLVDSQHISRCAAVIPPLHRKIFSLQPNHRGVNKGTASSLPIPAISPSPFDLTAPGLQRSGSILRSQFDYFSLALLGSTVSACVVPLQRLDELSTVGLLCAQAIPALCKFFAHPVIPNLHASILDNNLFNSLHTHKRIPSFWIYGASWCSWVNAISPDAM